ncbi:hypothetical protein [Pseudomonas citronellolis]|uniref:hypothetical protein n=1 Tax=Pseudomonas citronellolis TaxID=53408 RepID=UPI00248F1B9C|nr:hypothetical protein [Pseudomonas citronellolis]
MAHAPSLIYLVYGRQTYHQEALFSIASAIARARETPQLRLDIQVVTDDGAPYAGLPVRVRHIDAGTLAGWYGPHGYHFRAKHVALRQALDELPAAVLIDTDTFFRVSPARLFAQVRPGALLCNAVRHRLGDSQAPVYRQLIEPLKARGLADERTPLINSGVIGLAREDAAVLDRSLELMDDLYPIARAAYNLEEFVLAIAAYRQLEPVGCTDLIHHYWSRKQLFRAKVQAWLHKHRTSLLSPLALDDTQLVTDRLPRPPRAARLLYKLRTLPLPVPMRQFSLELFYGCHDYDNEFDRACGPVWWEKAATNVIARHPDQPVQEQLGEWLNHKVLRHLLGPRLKEIRQHLRQQDLL